MSGETVSSEDNFFTLRGDALAFVSALPPETRDNTAKLIHDMQQRIGHRFLAETHKANVYDMLKFSKESMQECSAHINKLLSKEQNGQKFTITWQLNTS